MEIQFTLLSLLLLLKSFVPCSSNLESEGLPHVSFLAMTVRITLLEFCTQGCGLMVNEVGENLRDQCSNPSKDKKY